MVVPIQLGTLGLGRGFLYDGQLDGTERTTMKHRNQKKHAMGRMKDLASIFGVAVLIVVVAACGDDATATPPPTQDIPLTQDIPMTTVIAMAMANEIREIQVDAKKVTVYPKTIASGGADRFVSRIGDDADFIGLLIGSGVEVGPPNGVEITFEGVSAEEVQAAIFMALTASIVDEVVVTPTPGPALTPTPPPTANTTTIQVPQRPIIRLRHDGQVYGGVAGTFCWPDGRGVPGKFGGVVFGSICGDEPFHPWAVLDAATAVPVAMGDSIVVEIDADDRPKGLQVAIYDDASRTIPAAAAQIIKVETGFTTTFAVGVPAGIYYIRISGRWDDGDIAYKFKLMVTS